MLKDRFHLLRVYEFATAWRGLMEVSLADGKGFTAYLVTSTVYFYHL